MKSRISSKPLHVFGIVFELGCPVVFKRDGHHEVLLSSIENVLATVEIRLEIGVDLRVVLSSGNSS